MIFKGPPLHFSRIVTLFLLSIAYLTKMSFMHIKILNNRTLQPGLKLLLCQRYDKFSDLRVWISTHHLLASLLTGYQFYNK